MEPKVTIEYTWPSGDINKFDVYAMVSNDTEVFLIGFNHCQFHKDFTALGLKEIEVGGKSDDEFHVYFIKQQPQKHYQDIIDAPVGKKVKLLPDITTGFWTEADFIKIELTPERIGKLRYFENYTLIDKLGDFFLKHDYGVFHKKVTFVDYKI